MSAQSASESTPRTRSPTCPRSADPTAAPRSLRPGSDLRRFPSPRFGDYSRTRFESRVAFGGPDERRRGRGGNHRDPDAAVQPPGDHERPPGRLAGGGRARRGAEAARPARAGQGGPGGDFGARLSAEVVLRRDWVKAARFYASLGITEALFRDGVVCGSSEEVASVPGARPCGAS